MLIISLSLIKVEPAVADIRFVASVNKTDLTDDEQLIYTISLKGEAEKLPRLPEPEFADFDVLSVSRASNIRIQKGRINKEISRTYVLAPKSPGKFIIPSLKIKYKGKIYKTDAFNIEVKPGTQKSIPKKFPSTGKGVII
jgi:hypothetical protein